MTFILEQSKRPKKAGRSKQAEGGLATKGPLPIKMTLRPFVKSRSTVSFIFVDHRNCASFWFSSRGSASSLYRLPKPSRHSDFPEAGEYHDARVVLRHT